MRRALAALLVVIAACSAPAPSFTETPAPSREPGVLTVVAFLDLSGPRSALGTAQRNALQLWSEEQRSRKIPVKVRTVDVGESDAKLLLELRRAAVDEPADAAIIGTPVLWDDTLGRAIELASMPVLFTLPLDADPVMRTGGRWAFALAPMTPRLAAWEIDDAARRGALSPSLLLTLPASRVDPMAAALDAELARRSLGPITHVALPADGSVPPVVRSGLSVLRSVHCTAGPAACAAVADAARSAGAPTFFYLPYTTVPSEIGDRASLANRSIWPGSASTLPFDSPPVMPVNQMRERFLRAYGERWGAVGTPTASAYDALALLAAAADRGADSPATLRDAIERISMSLIASTYSFGPSRHAGADPADLAYFRWTGSAIAPALSPSLGTGLSPATTRPTPTP